MTTRRDVLRTGLRVGLGAALAGALPGVSFASVPGASPLVVVILRGALDGLAVAPPYADPDYTGARGAIAIARPGGAPKGALDLDGFFGLHPSLPRLHERWLAGELILVHATASGYRERSHFDGQNVLENGGDRPSGTASGWLNRALAAAGGGVTGLALGQNVPLILRGPAPVDSWAPSALPEVEPELLERLRDLYSNDATLAARLDAGSRIDALADGEMQGEGDAMRRAKGGGLERLKGIAETAGRLIASPGGPRVAVFDAGGWDTHAAEGGAEGQLAGRLKGLDEVLDALKLGLKDEWARTAVLVCTEFGRTVEVNGTRGTDHGTGAAAFVVGGAVKGRVVADWPGLAPRHRYEGRDLKPTTDLRSVAKGLVAAQLKVPERALADVFPGTDAVRPLKDLVRA